MSLPKEHKRIEKIKLMSLVMINIQLAVLIYLEVL